MQRISLAFFITLGMAGCTVVHSETRSDRSMENLITTEQLKARAAFDFNCPAAQLQVAEFGDTTRGVSGCTKKAEYQRHCIRGATDEFSCDWQRQGPVLQIAVAKESSGKTGDEMPTEVVK